MPILRRHSLLTQMPSKALLLLALCWIALPTAQAQEFNCRVEVNYSQLEGNKYTYLDELERYIEDYMNNHTWTEDTYREEERIDCEISIIMEEALTLTSFRARLVVTSSRPIYGTTASTTVVRINDTDWQFEYAQGTPLVFEIERFSPLTTVLDFYAYIMLGYDYDSFSELGGTPHFQRARRIAELAQAQGGIGWSQVGSDRNRTQLITQILDPRFVPLRKAYFTYHFNGLDHFINRTAEARQAVLTVLGDLQTLYQELSRQYTLDLFFDTKYQELAAIFEQSPLSSEAYARLSEVDPAHMTAYNRLVQ